MRFPEVCRTYLAHKPQHSVSVEATAKQYMSLRCHQCSHHSCLCHYGGEQTDLRPQVTAVPSLFSIPPIFHWAEADTKNNL